MTVFSLIFSRSNRSTKLKQLLIHTSSVLDDAFRVFYKGKLSEMIKGDPQSAAVLIWTNLSKLQSQISTKTERRFGRDELIVDYPQNPDVKAKLESLTEFITDALRSVVREVKDSPKAQELLEGLKHFAATVKCLGDEMTFTQIMLVLQTGPLKCGHFPSPQLLRSPRWRKT